MNKIALRIGINHHWNNLYYQSLNFMDPRHPLPLYKYIKQDQHILKLLKGFYPLSKIEIHKTREGMDIYICRDNYINYPLVGLMTPNQVSNPGGRAPFTILSPPRVESRLPHNPDPQDLSAGGASNMGTLPLTPAQERKIARARLLGVLQNNTNSFNLKGISKLKMHRTLLNILKTRIQLFNLYTFPIHEAELLVGYLLREEIQKGSGSNSIKNKARLNSFKRLWKMGIIKGVKIKIQGRYKKSTRAQNEAYQFGQIPNTPTTNLRIKLFYATRILFQSLGTSSLHIYIVYARRSKNRPQPTTLKRGSRLQ